MASAQTSGPIVRNRGRGVVGSKVGKIAPEFVVSYNTNGIAGVTSFIFAAPKACRVVGIRELHEVSGGASSKIQLRKHAAGQTAAAGAATSGTVIQDLVTGGIAADTTPRVVNTPTLVTASSADVLAAGAKLAIIPPAAWIGVVDVYLVWT